MKHAALDQLDPRSTDEQGHLVRASLSVAWLTANSQLFSSQLFDASRSRDIPIEYILISRRSRTDTV